MSNIFRPLSWWGSRRTTESRPESADFDSAAGDGRAGSVVRAAAPAEPAKAVDEPPRAADPDAVRRKIEELAYRNWCEAGCPPGRDLEIWCAAEREVLEKWV